MVSLSRRDSTSFTGTAAESALALVLELAFFTERHAVIVTVRLSVCIPSPPSRLCEKPRSVGPFLVNFCGTTLLETIWQAQIGPRPEKPAC